MPFQPLTPEQFQAARNANFSVDQIIANEKTRQSQFVEPITTSPRSLYEKLIDNPITRGIQSLFPGAKLGQAIGSSVAAITNYAQGNKEAAKIALADRPTPLQVGGDLAQGALTVASPYVGGGASALGRIGANAALGAGIGATGAVAENKGLGDIAKSTALGGVVGGTVSGVAEGISALAKNLPNWLTQKALPKLEKTNIDYALKNTKLGSIDTLMQNSDQAVKSYGGQITSILEHPQYANNLGDGSASLQGVIEAFPNAKLDATKVADTVSKVVPGSTKLIDKISEGTATLLEKNQLRQQIDLATKKIFTDTPDVSFAKQVAASLGQSLRNEVKGIAPETEPIFENFTKEMNLNKALTAVQRRLQKGSVLNLYDLMAALEGFGAGLLHGGSPEALMGAGLTVGAEKLARSPAIQIAGAKAVNILGKTAPVLSAVGKAVKAPALKAITSQ